MVAVAAIAGAVAFQFGPWTGSSAVMRSDMEGELDLTTQPADIVAAYHYAEGHQSLLREIPCYCGCGKSIGHRDLFDCFVIRTGVYSDHASGCMVCANEARDVERLSAEGKSAAQIHDWIDGEYSRYGPPTQLRN